MKELFEIIELFISAEKTCDSVINYFSKNKKPKGPYYDLMKYFKGVNKECSKSDENYKNWILHLLKENKKEKLKESIVLYSLLGYYKSIEDLKKFVFLENDDKLEYNQKWHFFIGYWGYREFAAKHPDECNGITPLRIDDKKYVAQNCCPFKNCPEGKIWYYGIIQSINTNK